MELHYVSWLHYTEMFADLEKAIKSFLKHHDDVATDWNWMKALAYIN